MGKKNYLNAIGDGMVKVSLFAILAIAIIEDTILAFFIFCLTLVIGGFAGFYDHYRK